MGVSPGRDINYREEAHTVRRSILVNAPVSRVWKALATAEGLALWLMPNDFQPVVGTRFTFTSEPEQEWEGVVECMLTLPAINDGGSSFNQAARVLASLPARGGHLSRSVRTRCRVPVPVCPTVQQRVL